MNNIENILTNALNKLANEDIKKHKRSQKRKAKMDLKEKNAKAIELMNKIAKEEGVG